MLEIFVTIGLAWIVSNTGNVNELLGEDYKKPTALIGLVLGLVVSIYAGRQAYLRLYSKHIHRPADLVQALRLSEASGGSAKDGTAYVVDDEIPALFVSNSISREGYFTDFRMLRLLNSLGTPLGKGDVDDLEGVAADPGSETVYLVTSHSNNKNSEEKPSRRRLLQIDLTTKTDQAVTVKARADLRSAIESVLWPSGVVGPEAHRYPRLEGSEIRNVDAVMEVEGLAMDASGILYFGLRAPRCSEGGALILSARADAIFTSGSGTNDDAVVTVPASVFKRYCVGTGDTVSGIVSMEFDAQTQEILVLTGSPNPYEVVLPQLCRWSPSDSQRLRGCTELPRLEEPQVGKQEALLLARSAGRVITLLDTDDRLGGQISYTLGEAGLR